MSITIEHDERYVHPLKSELSVALKLGSMRSRSGFCEHLLGPPIFMRLRGLCQKPRNECSGAQLNIYREI